MATDLSALQGSIADTANMVSTVKMNKQNWKRQKEMFNMVNEYNAPIAQVQRLKQAGLNPALMYQGSPQNVAQSQKATEGTAPKSEFNLSETLQRVAQTQLTNEQSAQMQVKNDLLTANIQLLNTKIDDITSQIKKRETFENPNLEADLRFKNQQILNSQEMARNAIATRNLLEQEYSQKSEMFPISKQHQDLQNQKLQSEINTIKQQFDAFAPYQKLVLEKLSSEIKKLGKEASALEWENLFRSYDSKLREANISPNAGLIESLIKWTTLSGARIMEAFTGKNKFNNQNRTSYPNN